MTENRNEMPRGKHARIVSQDEGAYDAGRAEDAQGARQGGYAQDAYQGKHAHGISQSENMQDGRQGRHAHVANQAESVQSENVQSVLQSESAQTERAQACQSKRAQGARRAKYARGKHAQPVERQSLTASLNQVVDSRAATPQKRKTLWAAAFLVAIAALLMGAGLTYSAFSGNDHLKAVPVTGESQSLFASDTLAPYKTTPSEDPEAGKETIAGRNVVVDASGSQCSFTFKIYNCLLDDPNVFNDREVTYTLSVVAKSVTGQKSPVSSGWSIKLGEDGAEKEPDANGMVTFDATELPGTKGVINKYKITLQNTKLVDTTTFVIRATVDDKISPGTTLNCLAAKVSPVQRADVESASVTGGWADSGDPDVAYYAAYNYRVTVTGKSQNVTLTWGDNLELDPFFETNHPGCAINGNTVTYTAEAGSEIVNFYRAAGSAAPKEWSDITVSVSGSN